VLAGESIVSYKQEDPRNRISRVLVLSFVIFIAAYPWRLFARTTGCWSNGDGSSGDADAYAGGECDARRLPPVVSVTPRPTPVVSVTPTPKADATPVGECDADAGGECGRRGQSNGGGGRSTLVGAR